MMCDEKVIVMGISQGSLMLFIMELWGGDYVGNKAVNFVRID